LLEVLRTRSSATLNLPLSVMNVVNGGWLGCCIPTARNASANPSQPFTPTWAGHLRHAGTLWLVYGLAISDYFIAVPNGVGALLGAVYCVLICIFPRKSAK
jgi:solute carrier family 50 protein (sugar transporter)